MQVVNFITNHTPGTLLWHGHSSRFLPAPADKEHGPDHSHKSTFQNSSYDRQFLVVYTDYLAKHKNCSNIQKLLHQLWFLTGFVEANTYQIIKE